MKRISLSAPALIVGLAVLLLLTTTGGAVAGGLITGKKIKDGTVTSADIKDKTVTSKDLAASAMAATGATGPAGPAGAAGAKGANGAQGPRGFSAWDTIPTGVTVTGELIVDTSTTGSAASDEIAVDLPGTVPVPLTSTTVNFKNGTGVSDADATCTGTYSNPTAPPGKVCLYINGSASAMTNIHGDVESLPSRAFVVGWSPDPTAKLDMFVWSTWAYTAP